MEAALSSSVEKTRTIPAVTEALEEEEKNSFRPSPPSRRQQPQDVLNGLDRDHLLVGGDNGNDGAVAHTDDKKEEAREKEEAGELQDREKEAQHLARIHFKRKQRREEQLKQLRGTRSLSPRRRVYPQKSQSDATTTTDPFEEVRKTVSRSLSANVVRNTAAQVAQFFGQALEFDDDDDDDDDDEEGENHLADYRVKQEEINTLVNDRDEFARLKLALKEKGAVTNEMLKQRLHVYVHKNRQRLNCPDSISDSQLETGHIEPAYQSDDDDQHDPTSRQG